MTIIYTPPTITTDSFDMQLQFDTLFYSLRSLIDDLNEEIANKVQLPTAAANLYLYNNYGGW